MQAELKVDDYSYKMMAHLPNDTRGVVKVFIPPDRVWDQPNVEAKIQSLANLTLPILGVMIGGEQRRYSLVYIFDKNKMEQTSIINKLGFTNKMIEMAQAERDQKDGKS